MSAPHPAVMQPHLAAAVLTQLHHAAPGTAVRPAPPAGKPDCEFTLDDLRDYFTIPAKQAAKKLNIGITKLKLVSRQLGIRRWPYRTLRAAAKKPSSKLAARVRKEGILKMIALPESKLRSRSSASFGSSNSDSGSDVSSVEEVSPSRSTSTGSATGRHNLDAIAAAAAALSASRHQRPNHEHNHHGAQAAPVQPIAMPSAAAPMLYPHAAAYPPPVAPASMMMRGVALVPMVPNAIAADPTLHQLYLHFQDFGRVVYSMPPAPPLVPLSATTAAGGAAARGL